MSNDGQAKQCWQVIQKYECLSIYQEVLKKNRKIHLSLSDYYLKHTPVGSQFSNFTKLRKLCLKACLHGAILQ
jgi:hypothetical protein